MVRTRTCCRLQVIVTDDIIPRSDYYSNQARMFSRFCRYLFLVDDWLSAAEGDGLIDRTTHLSNSNEVAQGRSLLQNNIKRKFFDDHIWLSVGYRKSRSPFTRVQRLCCCVAILFLMMITNAMFYGRSSATGNQAAIVIGPIRMTIMQLYTSIISSAIAVPPMLVITTIFTRARPRINRRGRQSKYAPQALAAAEHADLAKKRGLPWWMIYFAYALLVAAVAASAFFTILYAFEWGKAKSEKWLVTFILGFVESVFLIEPMQVSSFCRLCVCCVWQ